MIIANEIFSTYRDYIKLVKILGKEVHATLYNYCEKKSFPFVWRYKSIESVSEKVESGRFQSWEEIDDIYACTIIIPNLNMEEEVIDDIKRFFNITKILARGSSRKPPNVFRFDSTRIIAKLNDFAETKPIARIPFEIQIKSAFEYAWAITTHSLTYKTQNPSWKRYRLSAQLKASVEQLDTLVLGFEDMADKIKSSYDKSSSDKYYLSERMNSLFQQGILPHEYLPKDMSRHCENMLNLLHALKWYKNSQHEKKLFYILQYFEYCLNQMSHIPRSLSLFQLFLGCLAKGNYIYKIADSYSAIITSEMKQFFPETSHISKSFNFINVV